MSVTEMTMVAGQYDYTLTLLLMPEAEWQGARHDDEAPLRGNTTRARVPNLLKGIVQGSDGRALTPWFTRKKNGRLYRYYLPVRENKEHAGASGLLRLPAAELEAAVLEQMRCVLRAPEMVAGVTERAVRLDLSQIVTMHCNLPWRALAGSRQDQ